MKLFVRIKYDGTAYAGYQVQKNAVTVQQRLNEAASDLFGFECDITGCSRTDAGVHASDFCATVQKRGESSLVTGVPIGSIPRALSVRLPDDIAVYSACFVDDEFHARYSVVSKTYTYTIYNSAMRDPFSRFTAYHHPKHIDDTALKNMQIAASDICGTHDFSAFMASGSSVTDTVRTVKSCTVERFGDKIVVSVSADGFLYNMVRIICGTLLDVARSKISPSEIQDIINSKDRTRAGSTLPPQGLCLVKVEYPDCYGLNRK